MDKKTLLNTLLLAYLLVSITLSINTIFTILKSALQGAGVHGLVTAITAAFRMIYEGIITGNTLIITVTIFLISIFTAGFISFITLEKDKTKFKKRVIIGIILFTILCSLAFVAYYKATTTITSPYDQWLYGWILLVLVMIPVVFLLSKLLKIPPISLLLLTIGFLWYVFLFKSLEVEGIKIHAQTYLIIAIIYSILFTALIFVYREWEKTMREYRHITGE